MPTKNRWAAKNKGFSLRVSGVRELKHSFLISHKPNKFLVPLSWVQYKLMSIIFGVISLLLLSEIKVSEKK